MKKKAYNLIQVIIIIIVTSIISGITVGIIFNKAVSTSYGISYAKLLEDKKIKEFLDIYSALSDDYYKDVDKNELLDNAIESMTEYLDESYTTYLDQSSSEKLNQALNSTYKGIGLSIQNNKIISVVAMSPASKAGIEPGDEIISINNYDTSNMLTENITSLLNENDKAISITTNRNGNISSYTLEKESLPYPAIQYYVYNETNIGYIKISIFSKNLDNEIEYALDYFEKKGISGIVLDLRDNSGGYLDQAKSVASLFLEKNKIIYYLETKDNIEKIIDEDNNSVNIPIILLINKKTASSAEILASALIDNNKAQAVGETTYGKGKVQHVYKLSNGKTLKYTSSNWLTPNKESIDTVGIVPKYIVENEYIIDENNSTIIKDIIDRQLEYGIELLRK